MKECDSGFNISDLGERKVKSPLTEDSNGLRDRHEFVWDDQHVIYNVESGCSESKVCYGPDDLLEKAGPREKIYFDPGKIHAGIVTCGGLCPGLNDVIRSIVMGLWYHYRVHRISGIQYGYRGFLPEFRLPVIDLNPERVTNIHRMGGTLLGSSRGHGDNVCGIVDSIERMNLNMLFVIGGDGTQKGALDISQEIESRGLKVAVVGIPKTIDNDLSFVQKSFGFETAVAQAVSAVAGAHVEAQGAFNGVGIVKVMGRQSGFIAAHTALAINDVNFVLIPEVDFDLEGENGLFSHLEKRILKRSHAVVLVAEGAGQHLMEKSNLSDASGNTKLTDIGIFLKTKINEYFRERQVEITLKYIDPSYIIRSAPANANDSIYCARLGTNAVHAAMAGKSGLLISLIHGNLVHVPIQMAVARKNQINPEKELWRDVVAATGQPRSMICPEKSQETGDLCGKQDRVEADPVLTHSDS